MTPGFWAITSTRGYGQGETPAVALRRAMARGRPRFNKRHVEAHVRPLRGLVVAALNGVPLTANHEIAYQIGEDGKPVPAVRYKHNGDRWVLVEPKEKV